jgi:2-haloacid dehalogenase
VIEGLRACFFDVFGTVVDWHGSITRELASRGAALGLDGVDWPRFARDWRARYQPAMEAVRSGRRPWVPLDVLHRENLLGTLHDHGIRALPDAEVDTINDAWHRLDPWPDAVEGVARMKVRYVVAPCSNGNVSLIVDMAKRAGLPWDVVLGAEPTRAYKPDPEAYLGSCRILGLAPEAVLMVAAHNRDLDAARSCGLRTAFVPRPTEGEVEPSPRVDLAAADFVTLAAALGC